MTLSTKILVLGAGLVVACTTPAIIGFPAFCAAIIFADRRV